MSLVAISRSEEQTRQWWKTQCDTFQSMMSKVNIEHCMRVCPTSLVEEYFFAKYLQKQNYITKPRDFDLIVSRLIKSKILKGFVYNSNGEYANCQQMIPILLGESFYEFYKKYVLLYNRLFGVRITPCVPNILQSIEHHHQLQELARMYRLHEMMMFTLQTRRETRTSHPYDFLEPPQNCFVEENVLLIQLLNVIATHIPVADVPELIVSQCFDFNF